MIIGFKSFLFVFKATASHRKPPQEAGKLVVLAPQERPNLVFTDGFEPRHTAPESIVPPFTTSDRRIRNPLLYPAP